MKEAKGPSNRTILAGILVPAALVTSVIFYSDIKSAVVRGYQGAKDAINNVISLATAGSEYQPKSDPYDFYSGLTNKIEVLRSLPIDKARAEARFYSEQNGLGKAFLLRSPALPYTEDATVNRAISEIRDIAGLR